MGDIAPIETVYRGYRFRSRLEARWAVYFDALGIEFEYEPEGYDLGDAGWYLPDFWLPQVRLWAEVKRGEFLPDEVRRCQALAGVTGHEVVMLAGPPDCVFYDLAYDDDVATSYVLVSDFHGYCVSERRFYVAPGYDNPIDEGAWTPTAQAAIEAARAERFDGKPVSLP